MFKKILVPVDIASEDADARPLAVALELANSTGAELHILTVVPDFGMSIVGAHFDKAFEAKALADTRAKLDAFTAERVSGEVAVQTHVGHGRIYEEIRRAADKLSCDVIVIGAHRPELKDYLLGPNAARVVRHAAQSVFVVRDA